MADGLPEGLISTNEGVTGDIERAERVEAEDIQKLWKAYSTNRAVLAENIGRRLENFFWRIWSNERVRQRMSGSQVAAQFSSINEGGYIRTTPTNSPRSSRNLGSYYVAARGGASSKSTSSNPPAPSPATHPPSSQGSNKNGQYTPPPPPTPTPTSPLTQESKANASSEEKRRSVIFRPPPILKKSRSGSSQSLDIPVVSPASNELQNCANPADTVGAIAVDATQGSAAQMAVSDAKSPPHRKHLATRFSEEVSVSIPKISPPERMSPGDKSTRPQSQGGKRPGKRNPVVHTSSKKRPAMVRQRSSQSSHISTKTTQLSSPPTTNTERSEPVSTDWSSISDGNTQGSETRRSRAVSPHPSENRKHPSLDVQSRQGTLDNSAHGETSEQENQSPLIDPDFRSQFVERKQPQHRSLTHLPSAMWKSTASVATPAFHQASGMMDTGSRPVTSVRRTGRDAFTDEIAPLKAPAPAVPGSISMDDPSPLPRTKSQLTLLLEKSRVSRQEQKHKKPEKN